MYKITTMQKFIWVLGYVVFIIFFLGVLFMFSNTGTSLFTFGFFLFALMFVFLLIVFSFIFLKKASAFHSIIYLLFCTSIFAMISGLASRYFIAASPFSPYRHYMDFCFNVFFSGLILMITLLISILVYIAFFKKEKDFVG